MFRLYSPYAAIQTNAHQLPDKHKKLDHQEEIIITDLEGLTNIL